MDSHIRFPMLAQMGKDVVTFLSWAAEPEMEERKLVIASFFFLFANNLKEM